jgi:polyphosphate kinase
VEVHLIVRGICCLRPGLKRISQSIAVRSIVDRFLEHSRIYYFENACQPEVFISSADWMPRNFFRRIELAVPIHDGILRDRLISEILAVPLADNVKARILRSDGTYRLATPGPRQKHLRSQAEFMRLVSTDPTPSRRSPRAKPAFPQVRLAPRPAELDKR